MRILHKESGSDRTKDIALKNLSSGEKQQAILSLVYSIISEYRNDDTSNLILAVDEPESSLHISACYDQFEKLYILSNSCCQTLFTSHWYGFIPAITDGAITNIVNTDGKHIGHIFNIQKYREEIKLKDRECSTDHHYSLPIDITLKSSNDFVQSILMSVICENSYNWLICEGSSDKIYLDAYLKNEILNNRLRIIPVCAASEVIKTYKRLSILFDEMIRDVKGKVYLLLDTDAQSVELDTLDRLDEKLRCRRIVNDEHNFETKLVKINSNPKAPNTDIEDALSGKLFIATLKKMIEDGYSSDLSSITLVDRLSQLGKDIPSRLALDIRASEMQQIDEFFNANKGSNKVRFAQEYVQLIEEQDTPPLWITEIKDYFSSSH